MHALPRVPSYPDPSTGPAGEQVMDLRGLGIDLNSPTFQAANKACQKIIPGSKWSGDPAEASLDPRTASLPGSTGAGARVPRHNARAGDNDGYRVIEQDQFSLPDEAYPQHRLFTSNCVF